MIFFSLENDYLSHIDDNLDCLYLLLLHVNLLHQPIDPGIHVFSRFTGNRKYRYARVTPHLS